MRYRYAAEPHPHILIDELVPPDVYASMRFPDELIAPGAWGITSSDPEYQLALQDPLWRAFHDEVRGEAFVSLVLNAFAPEMERAGCLVDAERARLVPFVESRAEKEMSALPGGGDPNEI